MIGFVLVAWLALGVLVLVMNNRTLKHRHMLIDAISAQNRQQVSNEDGWKESWNLWADLELVSYEKHMLRLLTFRNPWSLYSARLQAALGVSQP